MEPCLHSPYVSMARCFIKHRGKFTTKKWFSNCFIHDPKRTRCVTLSLQPSQYQYFNMLRKTQNSLKPILGCDPGLGIQTRLLSVGGSHEHIRHMGRDNVNPIQMVNFRSGSTHGRGQLNVDRLREHRVFHHSLLPAEQDKVDVFYF